MAKSHPPGIAHPEEGRPVRAFEIAVAGSHAQWTVYQRRIIFCVGRYLYFAGDAVKALVRRNRRFRAERMFSQDRRRITHLPGRAARPKRGDVEFFPRRIGENGIEDYLIKRVRILNLSRKRHLDHDVCLGRERKVSCPRRLINRCGKEQSEE